MKVWGFFILLSMDINLIACGPEWPTPTCTNHKGPSYTNEPIQVIRNCTIVDVNETLAASFVYNPVIDYNSYYRHITADRIQEVNFHNSTLLFIPSKFFTTFNQLQILNISECHLTEIARNDFRDAQKLLIFDGSNNDIEFLKDSVFFGSENLVHLDLSFNRITDISNNAIQNLEKLEMLVLSNNKLKTLNNSVFAKLKSLTWLDLQNNEITVVESDFLKNSRNLEFIDISENKLVTFDGTRFVNLSNPIELNLSWNKISSFSSGDSGYSKIYLNDNELSELTLGFFVTYVNAHNNRLSGVNFTDEDIIIMDEIHLRNNSINNLSFLKQLASLLVLDVSLNRIETIELSTFSNLETLDSLYLENISLSQIDYGLFAHQKHLKILDISYNSLKQIDFNMFSAMESLEQLFIEGNDLTNISIVGLKSHFPRLNQIGLADNYWDCAHLTDIIKSVNAKLYIAANNIVTNSTNVAGIYCINSNSNITRPGHTNTPDSHANLPNLNWEQNEKIQSLIDENSHLQTRLDELSKKLDDLQNRTTDSSKDDEKLKYLTKEVVQLGKADESVKVASSDMSFVKIILVVILVAGLAFVCFKVVISYMKKRNLFQSQEYRSANTVRSSIEDNSL